MEPGSLHAAELLAQRADRLATTFRQLLSSQVPTLNGQTHLLDGVAESFIRELGFSLLGVEGHPWSRCAGVLRLSNSRGELALRAEFGVLRHFLDEALRALGGTRSQRVAVRQYVGEALRSATGTFRSLRSGADPARIPFGGLVIELFEAKTPRRAGVVALVRRQEIQ